MREAKLPTRLPLMPGCCVPIGGSRVLLTGRPGWSRRRDRACHRQGRRPRRPKMARNHPLFDGDTRLAWQSLTVFVALNGYTLATSADDAVAFMLGIAAGEVNEEGLRPGSASASSRSLDQRRHPSWMRVRKGSSPPRPDPAYRGIPRGPRAECRMSVAARRTGGGRVANANARRLWATRQPPSGKDRNSSMRRSRRRRTRWLRRFEREGLRLLGNHLPSWSQHPRHRD